MHQWPNPHHSNSTYSITITNQATNQHTDQTSPFTNKPEALVLGFQTEVKKNWKKKRKKRKGKMRDFLQSAWGLSHSHFRAPKLLIFLANLVDLHLRGSGVDSSALVWAQWCFLVSYGAGLGSVLLPWGSWSLSISRKRGGYGRKRGRDEYMEGVILERRERKRDQGMREGNRKREKE